MFVRLSFLLCLLSATLVAGYETNFIAVDAQTGHVVSRYGHNHDARMSPYSTFKIPLSLMGYDTGILSDEDGPEWSPGGPVSIEAWKGPQTPKTWMSRSVVWYSQTLTSKIGVDRITRYLHEFGYGNADMSGDPGKEHGLAHAWLGSSLKISADEQVVFLQKLVLGNLSVSPHALQMTKNILFVEDLCNGWRLFGKTGTGFQNPSPDGSEESLGWYVGWVERKSRAIVFAMTLRGTGEMPPSSQRVDMTKKFLKEAGVL